ncbi:MAG TPA: hypothetical protein VKV95_21205 [Terriglobia bacterium]|nr:hypothetical protein [Terriglobia bacterium]
MSNEMHSGSRHQGAGVQGGGQSGTQNDQRNQHGKEHGQSQQSDRGAYQSGQPKQARPGSDAHKCEVCGAIFTSEEERRKHKQTIHDKSGKDAGDSGR